MTALAHRLARRSFLEATARGRIAGIVDDGSFEEFLGPRARLTSPHLATLGQPGAFDDGLVCGRATLDGKPVLIAAQEGAFMGGAVGEVHGAKLTGLLERAADERPAGVVLLLDTGGVRLHEANAGLAAIAEIQRAVFDARAAGVPVIAVIGSANGAFGGIGIVAKCCDYVVMSEEGRMSVSGPEVIETTHGIEEFDAQDRALVWRTMGGKHRTLTGDADACVADDIDAFQGAIAGLLGAARPLDLDAVKAEHARLGDRLARFGDADDALDTWRALGVEDPDAVPGLDPEAFAAVAAEVRSRDG